MKYLFILIAIGMILYFSLLGLRGLCEPDEGRYAEIAREMIEKKDYLIPRLNYIKHMHKPPLAYWLVAASFGLFGMNEFTARLPVAILAVSGLIITFFFAVLTVKNKKAAFLSSLVLATSLQYFIWSQVLAADMIFSFFIYLALFGFFCWYTSTPKRKALVWRYRGKENCIYIFYLSLAFAFMVKGPVAVIIPALIILTFAGFVKEWDLFRRIKLLKGSALFLLIAVPWFVYVCLKNPGLLNYFVFNQSLGRLFSTVHGREGNMFYFVPVLIIGFLPWILFLPSAVLRYKPWRKEDKIWLFFSLWIIVPLVFFSFSRSKLPGYILPVYPAMAIMVGSYIYEKGYFRRVVGLCIIMSVLYLVSTAVLPQVEEKLGSNLSIRKIAGYINKRKNSGDMIVNYRCFLQGLPFYMKGRVVLVEKEREIQFEGDVSGYRDYIFSNIYDFWGSVGERQRIWCFSPIEDYKDLQENSPVTLHEVWQSSEYVLVSNYEK